MNGSKDPLENRTKHSKRNKARKTCFTCALIFLQIFGSFDGLVFETSERGKRLLSTVYEGVVVLLCLSCYVKDVMLCMLFI